VVKPGQDAGFSMKLLLGLSARGLIHAGAEQDFFDGTAATFQAQIFRLIDRSHATRFNRLDDSVPFA
jgi:hypothetical protein